MGGGSKRRSSNNNRNSDNKARNSKRSSGANPNFSASSSCVRRRRNSLFVEGGILSDFRLDSPTVTPFRGGKSLGKGSNSGNSDRAKASASKTGIRKSDRNAIGYQYPLIDVQESAEIAGKNKDDRMDQSNSVVLVDSQETKIVAYLDRTPSSLNNQDVSYDYEYAPNFVLGGGSHRGLGFVDESDATPSCTVSFSKQMEGQEGLSSDSTPSEEIVAEEGTNCEDDTNMVEEVPDKRGSSRKNSGFISIGGMKLYTVDISDGESNGGDDDVDNEDDGASQDEESSESSEQGELSESSTSCTSEDMSDSDSDIDEEVVEDYLEGIGGNDTILDAHWLLEQSLNISDGDSSSPYSFNATAKKLSDIALQEASREYGMKKTKTRNHSSGDATGAESLALDDLMLAKDPRGFYGRKKKQTVVFPRSWPSEAQKSKTSRRFPGEKKKHRKEMIAVKRRERMLRRGVDLVQINSKLEQIVLDGVDMHCFWPMHHRDCSQVRRLASIYKLASSCQGSGKKSFVAVTRTRETCMPSSSDKIRLEKLIGAGDEDSDFAVNQGLTTKSASANRNKAKKNSAMKHSTGEARERYQTKTKKSYADQPVSFVSSGLINSETVEVKASDDDKDTRQPGKASGTSSAAEFGAFEVHTKGFGSKMMAKMGFIEGGGLGKDGKGTAQPIKVVQRPKSLGLGLDYSVDENNARAARSEPRRNRAYEKHTKGFSNATSKPASEGNETKRLGAFEKHTKGFGSKIMAKMGFVEGTGLGKDSQGIANPLVAVRRPKARGLGAKS